jgi:hypothetical protein
MDGIEVSVKPGVLNVTFHEEFEAAAIRLRHNK